MLAVATTSDGSQRSLCSRARDLPWLAVSVALAAGALSLGWFGPSEAFALLRDRVGSEMFRLWTGHAVHFNAAHLWGDLLAFAVWAAWLERRSRRALAVILFAGTPALSLALLWFQPSLAEYRGLSALDCGLVVALMLIHAKDEAPSRRAKLQRAVARIGLLLFVVKCVYELRTGHAFLAPELGPGIRLVPLSHLLGAGIGALVLLPLNARSASSGSSRREIAATSLLGP